jgi:hypothetical protein
VGLFPRHGVCLRELLEDSFQGDDRSGDGPGFGGRGRGLGFASRGDGRFGSGLLGRRVLRGGRSGGHGYDLAHGGESDGITVIDWCARFFRSRPLSEVGNRRTRRHHLDPSRRGRTRSWRGATARRRGAAQRGWQSAAPSSSICIDLILGPGAEEAEAGQGTRSPRPTKQPEVFVASSLTFPPLPAELCTMISVITLSLIPAAIRPRHARGPEICMLGGNGRASRRRPCRCGLSERDFGLDHFQIGGHDHALGFRPQIHRDDIHDQ